MHYIKFHLLLIFLFSAYISSRGQLIFVQKEHDLGSILLYTDHEFTITITNKGDKVLPATDIRTSSSSIKVHCGVNSIAPKESALIKVSVNEPLLGHFDKTLSIYSDGSNSPSDIMHIKGNVVSELKVDTHKEDYLYHVGNIYLSTDAVEFDEITSGQVEHQAIKIYNAGSDLYHPELMHLPKYLSATAQPERILPGHTGKIILSLDSKLLPDMGLTQTSIYLSRFQGDNVGRDNEISISAVLTPSYDSTSVIQKELAPILDIPSQTIDLPAFGKKKKVKGKLVIKNIGKSSLIINSIQVLNPAIGVTINNSKIAPNASTNLNVTLQKDLLQLSRSRLRILLITSDPNHSKLFLNINAKD